MSEVNSSRNPSSEENWRCKICTYLNPSALRYCSACQGWRFEHIFSESSPATATATMDQTVVHLPSTSNNSIPLFLLPSPQTPIYSPSFEDFALNSPNSPSSSSSLTPFVSSPSTPTTSSPLPITFRPSVASRILREPSSPIPTSPCIQRAYSPPPPLPPNEPLESISDVLSERCPKPDPGVPILELPWDLELLYDRGRTLLMKISVRRNSKKAWELLQLAANRGHPAAQWDLLLRKPDSDEIDWDRAVEYYVMQMQTGLTNTNNNTNDNYSNNIARGYDHGAIAAFCLGCCFLGGWGVERREDRAVALYKIAVRRGYIKGLNEVGWIYDHGLGGVSQDSVGAFQCFNLLANRGYALAQYNTGRCYRDGRGVPSDWNKAVEWLVRASEQGYHNAQRSLGSMFQVGENQSNSSSTTTTTATPTSAATTSLPPSSSSISLLEKPSLPVAAQKKNKVKKDVVRAMILYRDSASNGDPAGVHKIQEMTSNTRVIYRGSGVFKEPVSYFMEVKLRQRKQRHHHHILHHSNSNNNNNNNNSNTGSSSNTNSPYNTPPQTVHSPILNSNNNNNNNSSNSSNTNNNNTKKEEEKKGEYWVPKLIDQCCLVLSRGKRDVWETANIPSSVKIKLDRETIQCSAGCGNAFYGKGRVTRSFVFMKLVVNNNNSNTRSLLLEQAKLRGNGSEYYIGTWRDFGANSETTAMWRDTRKIVTMPFCSGACAEGFLQRSYWDF